MTRTRKIRTAVVSIVLAAGIAAGATACDKASEPFKDAPRTGTVNSAPADIIENADGFSNISTKCDHGNRIYTAYHGDSSYAAIAVVPQDPTCK